MTGPARRAAAIGLAAALLACERQPDALATPAAAATAATATATEAGAAPPVTLADGDPEHVDPTASAAAGEFADRREFGDVATGAELEHTFTWRNETPVEWRVERVHGGCRCIVPKVDTDRVVPGGALAIAVRVDTLGFEGARRSHVDVRLIDAGGRSRTARFAATWRTNEYILSAPRPLRFTDLGPGESKTVALALKSRDATPFRVLGARTSAAGARVELPETAVLAAVDQQLSVTLMGDAPPRRTGGVLEIETDDPRQPRLRLPIEIEIVPGWRLAPGGSVSIGRVASGERPVRVLEVAARQPRAGFDVVTATLRPKRSDEALDFLSVAVDRSAEGRIEVTVALIADPPRSHFFCDLEVTTNDPITPTQRIAVFGIRADGK